jgi:hypothetical protein
MLESPKSKAPSQLKPQRRLLELVIGSRFNYEEMSKRTLGAHWHQLNGAEHVSPAIYGELLPTVGKGLEAARERYDGMLVIGPFNCLPCRISEAILKPLSVQQGMPILTYESDGYAVSPSVLRQVDVHIRQVLEHAAGNHVAQG